MKAKITILLALLGGIVAQGETVITNIPVTVTITTSTNVVNGDNHEGCATCEGIRKEGWAIYHEHHGPYVPWKDATERWTITNAVRTYRIEMPWMGKVLSREEVISLWSVTNKWKLEWKTAE